VLGVKLSDMPQVKAWTADVGVYDFKTFILSSVSVAEAFSVATLIWPRFVEYKECVFLDFAFDEAGVDAWIKECNGDCKSVEAMVNHIHLWDYFAANSEIENEALGEVVARMAEAWRFAVKMQYPSRNFVVEVSVGVDNDYGPTLTLHST
jgi:hypothetical protein